jgi:reactive chlorine resistance protein C
MDRINRLFESAAKLDREGELVPANREWHEHNGTYLFAYGLGSVIVLYGLLSGAGWLVIKDAIMLGAALVTRADSAKAYLRKRIINPRAAVSERESALVSAAQ